MFRLVVVCGLLFAIQGVASLLGLRGFVGFWLILPAGIVVTVAGVACLGAVSSPSSKWATRTENEGVGVGGLITVIPFLIWFGVGAIYAQNVLAVAVFGSTAVAIVLIGLLLRRRN